MLERQPSSEIAANARSVRIRSIIADCRARRATGEALTDEVVAGEYPDLMPELGDELRKWSRVDAARGAARSDHPSSDAARAISDAISGYDILNEIHRGGQGIVYRAVQRSTRRTVAIKVLRQGPFAGPSDQRRFEREIEILSQLRHPNIVAIHDSGITDAAGDASCHYFVMDYVDGRPLDEHVAATGRDVRETLRLFAEVCEAVNAAHLRGVIHRDLKPGNIRVDDKTEPYVLDFGLAKLVDGAAVGDRVHDAHTATGQFVGSPPWCSPEQADGAALDIRTDVYSLGVLLFHALTGQFPYPIVGRISEVLDHVRSRAPLRPRLLRRDIDDEVETIVLKCLAKEPARRYQSAGELARDLRHYLTNEPIEAKRDSLVYIVCKHLARHRLAATAALLALLSITAGLVVSLVFWQEAAHQRQVAQGERDTARDAQQEAVRGRHEADMVVQLLEEVFGSRDPNRFLGPDATVRQMLDQHAATAFNNLAGEPRVEARLRATIGIAYDNLGLYEAAAEHLTRAAELLRAQSPPAAADLSRTLNDLALSNCALGRFDDAERVLREAQALDPAARAADPARTPSTLLNLGIVSLERGDASAAEAHFRAAIEAFERGGPSALDDLLSAKRLLGGLLADLGRFEEAEPLVRDALQTAEQIYPAGDSRRSACLDALGSVLHQSGRSREAVPLLQRAVAGERALLGDQNPRLAINLTNLGIVLQAAGDLDAAAAALGEALAIRRSTLSADHPDLGHSLHALASLAEARGRLDEAEALLVECIAILRKSVEEQHPSLQRAIRDLERIRKTSGDGSAATAPARPPG